MTFFLEPRSEDDLQRVFRHAIDNNDMSLIEIKYTYIRGCNKIAVDVSSSKQLFFSKWKRGCEDLFGVKLSDGVTIKSIKDDAKLLESSDVIKKVMPSQVVQPRPAKIAKVDQIDSPWVAMAKMAGKSEDSSSSSSCLVHTPVVGVPAISAPIEQDTPIVVTAVPVKIENPFEVDVTKGLENVKKFLVEGPVSTPVRFYSRPDDQAVGDYIAAKKKSMNRNRTPVEQVIHDLVPRIMKSMSPVKLEKYISQFDDEHKNVIRDLNRWFTVGGWNGFHLFYVPLFAEYAVYSYSDPTIALHACSLEMHRRVLCLEDLAASMTVFINAVISKKPPLNSFPPKVIGETSIVLMSGSGLFGAGQNFWRVNEGLASVRNLPNFTDLMTQPFKETMDLVNYLKTHRGTAMTHLGVISGDELTWGIPLLTLFVDSSDLVANLSEKSSAVTFLEKIRAFDEARKSVYLSDVVPVIKYGEKLTEYCQVLRSLCETFKATGRQYGVPYPAKTILPKLTPECWLVGPGSERLSLGHMEARDPPVVIPFVVNGSEGLVVDHPDVISEKFRTHYENQNNQIRGMLEKLQMDPDVPYAAIERMKTGQSDLLCRFNDDSHTHHRTSVLPATASLTIAGYSTHEVYKLYQ